MVINKLQIIKKEEESRSYKTLSLGSKLRRPDITASDRFKIGLLGLDKSNRDESIDSICERYKISRTFLYGLVYILKSKILVCFGEKEKEESKEIKEVLKSIRFVLQAKLETKGSLHGISSLSNSYTKYNSTNFISQAIEVGGRLLGNNLTSNGPLKLIYLSDEVYSGNRAILVTVEPQSMAVLHIDLLDGAVNQQSWEQSWLSLESNNITATEIVKDQGVSLQAAIGVLGGDVKVQADTFHAVSHKLGIHRSQLLKKVETAMEAEWERERIYLNTKTASSQAKQLKKLEAAKLATQVAIDRYEWFVCYYNKLLVQLRPFDRLGNPRDINKAENIMYDALEHLELLEDERIKKCVDHIRNLLNEDQLLAHLEKTKSLYSELQKHVPPNLLWLWTLFWQHWKKSLQTHNPSVQKFAKQEMEAAQQLLEQHYQDLDLLTQTKVRIFSTLNKIVQASSLVECFNSFLKPYINNARGQVTQPLLNLVMFYHNNRVFKRGIRKGKSPMQLLTGKVQASWIDLIMNLFEDAFLKYETTSLKQLHKIVCQQGNKEGKLFQLHKLLDVSQVA